VSELIDLSVSDVAKTMTSDGEVPVVRVRGKGSKERLVPLGSFALKAIEDYLTRTRPTYASKNSQTGLENNTQTKHRYTSKKKKRFKKFWFISVKQRFKQRTKIFSVVSLRGVVYI